MSFLPNEIQKLIAKGLFFLHIVDETDNSQNPLGSSFKITMSDARQGILNTAKYTAFPTGGQGSAIQLTAYKNNVETVATANDSVKMLPALVSITQRIKNNGAEILDLFPSSGNNFKGLGANIAIQLNPGTEIEFTCYTAGEYE